jgi:hypothetical protein
MRRDKMKPKMRSKMRQLQDKELHNKATMSQGENETTTEQNNEKENNRELRVPNIIPLLSVELRATRA